MAELQCVHVYVHVQYYQIFTCIQVSLLCSYNFLTLRYLIDVTVTTKQCNELYFCVFVVILEKTIRIPRSLSVKAAQVSI